MPFVKLDQGILDSTLWVDRESREVFITSLLLAEPCELREPLPQLAVRELKETGFVVPAGWYGMVHAAGVGIARRAMVEVDAAMTALERLCAPDPESRSADFEGRRLARVDGGFIVLNFMKYRDRDYTGAERARRYRERQKSKQSLATSRVTRTASHRNITQAEAEAEVIKTPLATKVADPPGFSPFWEHYPNKSKRKAAVQAWRKLNPDYDTQIAIRDGLAAAVKSEQWTKDGGKFIPHGSSWLNGERWKDQPTVAPEESRMGKFFI